jgi:predicted DsbA family dithiol-disulfide isomerase
LRREYGLTLRHTVFPLHPNTPEEGVELATLFAGSGRELIAMFDRLREVAAEVNLPLRTRERTYNSRRAQELGKWAEEQGAGEAFRTAVYHAYFVAGRNIAQPEELAALAEGIGLVGEEALRVVRERRYARAVDADWQRARELQVSAVPTFRYQQRVLVGFTSYQKLRQLIEE